MIDIIAVYFLSSQCTNDTGENPCADPIFVVARRDLGCGAHRRLDMHDVFIVISEGLGGGHMVRTVYAADHDDARQTHQANYADEPLVAVHQ